MGSYRSLTVNKQKTYEALAIYCWMQMKAGEELSSQKSQTTYVQHKFVCYENPNRSTMHSM